MGKRGPAPRPDSKNTAIGRNTYHRKTAPLPEVEPGSIPVPSNIKRDTIAHRFWRDHAEMLIGFKRLRPESAVTFGLLCTLYADTERLRAKVDEEGWTLESPKGPIQNPTAAQLHRVRSQYIALAKEFGLTAAAEARIPVEADSGEDKSYPLTQFGITG